MCPAPHNDRVPETVIDLWILGIAGLIWGLAWLGVLAAISLVYHCLRGSKHIDLDRFIARSLRISVVATAVVATGAVFIWIVWQWRPDFGFWGRFVQPYWRLGEGGMLCGITMMTAFLAVLRRRAKKKSGK